MQNHLKDQTSPYLLQHADNPVNWYPWCDEAFKRAKRSALILTVFIWRCVRHLQEAPTDEYPLKDDKTTFYMCRKRSCLPPTNEL